MNTEDTSRTNESNSAPASFFAGRRFILIVDDDPSVLTIAVDLLGTAGYQCLTARSASQALITLKNPDYAFDLMIADVTMSGMNGIDLMKIAVQLLPDLPVIIMSGALEVQTPVEALRAGSADYLIKPFDYEEFLSCVKRTLTKKTDTSARTQAETEAAHWQTAARAFALSLDARD